MIHTAGNPDPIAELKRDCLQALPLIDDREVLVWFKARANSIQRRTFSSTDPFEPPTLIRELLSWNEKLIPLAPEDLRDRLFLFKSRLGVMAFSSASSKKLLRKFCDRHNIPIFSLSSIRPTVLSSFYRASGNLKRVSIAANHKNLSTTVRYVESREVQEQFQLQEAFIGHVRKQTTSMSEPHEKRANPPVRPTDRIVSLFGFDCKDPYGGIAPGSHQGKLCMNFMGCFTCPNAVITSDPATLARLLQTRDHLRAASVGMHPARWSEVYSHQLNILEQDILPRFSISEIADAERYRTNLPPLPELR
jgi:hypothetical protein